LYVSFEAGRTAAHWHHRIFDLLLWLIALHILAVAWYWVRRRENLITPMFSGTRDYPGAPQPLRSASALRFVVGALLAGALTWLVARAFQPF
jgi:hypothetical protein